LFLKKNQKLVRSGASKRTPFPEKKLGNFQGGRGGKNIKTGQGKKLKRQFFFFFWVLFNPGKFNRPLFFLF